MTSLESGIEGGATAPPRRRCLDLNVKILYFFGFWPSEGEEERNWFYYWRYLLPRVILIRTIYGSIFHMININIVWGDPAYMVEYTILLGIHAMVFLKTATLFFYQEDLKAMFDELEKLHAPRMVYNDHMRKSLNNTEKFISRNTKTALIGYIVILIFSLVVQIVEGLIKRIIPFRLWMPYSYQKSPVFEITLLCVMIGSFIDLLILGVCFITFVAPAIITVGQFKLLSYKLTNICGHAEKKLQMKEGGNCSAKRGIGIRTQSVRKSVVEDTVVAIRRSRNLSVERCVDDVFGELNEDYIDTVLCEMETIMAELRVGQPRVARRVILIPEAKSKQEVEMENHLRHCIKHHQTLLGISKTLGRVFKMVLGLYVLFSVLGCLLTIYLTTMAKSLDSKMIGIFFLMVSLYYQLLCLCLIGGQISEQAENARDAVYDCDWFGASESFKLSMRIMVSRMNRPLVIKAGGLPLSVGTYRLMCRAAYYGHTGLTKLIRGEKIMNTA